MVPKYYIGDELTFEDQEAVLLASLDYSPPSVNFHQKLLQVLEIAVEFSIIDIKNAVKCKQLIRTISCYYTC